MLPANGSLRMNEDSVFLPSAFVQNLAVHIVRIKKALPQLMPSIYHLEAAGQPTTTKLLTDSTEMKNSTLATNYLAEATFGLWYNRDQFYYQLRVVAPAAIFGALVGYVELRQQTHQRYLRRALYWSDEKASLL
ncbi:hypothetical protein BDV33DRAFT_210802 [Aspergillus novoparasiticus]|uniref:Uncharacterized protein n=1 Tax=Aspergillus novoparasiticus TaxID=986946 RepID=A0A5N6E5J4_9EURO|nr:hypothetical protein BDV33DRAFT_210802 [Aspergillus novoparasiticus]